MPVCKNRLLSEGGITIPRSCPVHAGRQLCPTVEEWDIKLKQEEANRAIERAQSYVNETGDSYTYKSKFNSLLTTLSHHTGLQMDNEEEKVLLLIYASTAILVGSAVTREDIHEMWAIWTLYIRQQPNHPNMVPYEQLDERTRNLDKIDVWAIQEAVKQCG